MEVDVENTLKQGRRVVESGFGKQHNMFLISVKLIPPMQRILKESRKNLEKKKSSADFFWRQIKESAQHLFCEESEKNRCRLIYSDSCVMEQKIKSYFCYHLLLFIDVFEWS